MQAASDPVLQRRAVSEAEAYCGKAETSDQASKRGFPACSVNGFDQESRDNRC